MTRLLALGALLGLAAPGAAQAHAGIPRVVEIRFPAQRPGEVWAVSDDLGLIVVRGGVLSWLCGSAVHLDPILRSMAPVGAGPDTWLAASAHGLFRSESGGCDFDRTEGALSGHVPSSVRPHPTRSAEVLVGTETIGVPNDVFFSEDAGLTWTAAGLAVEGRIRPPVVRAQADPEIVYVAHAGGMARSEDGGRTFAPMTPGPPELDVAPEELYLLADHPSSAAELYAVVERFPQSTLIRTRDGGRSWAPVLQLDDLPDTLVFDRAGRRGLLVTPFVGVYRTADGGETWTHSPRPPVDLLGCVTRETDSDRLWGCTDTAFMGPWALGRSDDFGETWTPVLRAYPDLTTSLACPVDSEAARACEGLCPTVRLPVPCDSLDAGVADAGAADAGRVDATPDAAVETEAGGPSGGCSATSAEGGFALWMILVGLVAGGLSRGGARAAGRRGRAGAR